MLIFSVTKVICADNDSMILDVNNLEVQIAFRDVNLLAQLILRSKL